jgi:hypothetical protein
LRCVRPSSPTVVAPSTPFVSLSLSPSVRVADPTVATDCNRFWESGEGLGRSLGSGAAARHQRNGMPTPPQDRDVVLAAAQQNGCTCASPARPCSRGRDAVSAAVQQMGLACALCLLGPRYRVASSAAEQGEPASMPTPRFSCDRDVAIAAVQPIGVSPLACRHRLAVKIATLSWQRCNRIGCHSVGPGCCLGSGAIKRACSEHRDVLSATVQQNGMCT